MAKKPRSKKPASKTVDKERVIRSEKKLNPTGKVLWLLTSLSSGGYASVAEDEMAGRLLHIAAELSYETRSRASSVMPRIAFVRKGPLASTE